MNKENTQMVEVLPTLEMSEVSQDFQIKIRSSFGDLMNQAGMLVERAKQITVMDESLDQEKAARETRLALVKIRTGADKAHKEMKQDILVQGRAIDGAKNIVIAATQPSEKDMQEIENRTEIRAKQEQDRLHNERFDQLNQFTTAYNTLALGKLSAEEYGKLLDDAQLANEARIARDKKDEQDRINAEKAAEDERKRLEQERIDNERKQAQERAALEAQMKAERAERERIEAEAKSERDRANAEREKLEAQIKADREKAEATERALKAEADRLARIEADRIAAEKAANEAAEAEAKKAEMAPDKKKIAAYAIALSAIDIPTGTTEAGKKALAQVSTVIDTALAEIRTIYTTLK